MRNIDGDPGIGGASADLRGNIVVDLRIDDQVDPLGHKAPGILKSGADAHAVVENEQIDIDVGGPKLLSVKSGGAKTYS